MVQMKELSEDFARLLMHFVGACFMMTVTFAIPLVGVHDALEISIQKAIGISFVLGCWHGIIYLVVLKMYRIKAFRR